MLMGTYKHNIDKKGRLTMPQKLREDLGEQFVVTRGLDGCLFVYSEQEWAVMTDKIKQLPLSKGRDLQRYFFANATLAECDAMGRILIPQNLREAASLDKDAVIIGSGSRVEIWDKAVWEREDSELAGSRVIESMDELGF